MTVTFVANGAIGAGTTSPVSATAPICQDGDTLLALAANHNGGVMAAPAGWSELFQIDLLGAAPKCALFWKKAVASSDSGASFDFTSTGSSFGFYVLIFAWRGATDPDSPFDATAVALSENTSADAVTFSGYDPTASCHVVYMAFYRDDATTFAAAMSDDTNPDCTTRFDLETSVGNDFTFACTSGDNDGSAIGSRTWASNSATDRSNLGAVLGISDSGTTATDVFFENRHAIEQGMKPNTAAGMGGVLIE